MRPPARCSLARPSLTRLRGLVVILGAVVGSTACMQGPGEYGEEILLHPNGDVLAAGGDLQLTERLPGDAMVAGRSIRFDGSLGGSYVGAAGDQEVRGRIDGSVRAVGGSVLVDGSVGRNVTIGGGSVELRETSVVEGNAYIGAGSARLLGRVDGDVYVGAGEVELDGEVGGDVRVEAGSLTVGPDARIGGELRYRVREDGAVAISNEAVAAAGVRALDPRAEDEGRGVVLFVLRLLAFVLCGVLLAALFPGTVTDTMREMTARPAASLGLGLLWLLLGPLVVVVLAATVVGLPIALIVAASYMVSLYVAPVVPALWVGGEILHGRDPRKRGDATLLVATGGGIVAFAILLPWLGFLARLLATCLGLGAVALTIRDRSIGPAEEPRASDVA